MRCKNKWCVSGFVSRSRLFDMPATDGPYSLAPISNVSRLLFCLHLCYCKQLRQEPRNSLLFLAGYFSSKGGLIVNQRHLAVCRLKQLNLALVGSRIFFCVDCFSYSRCRELAGVPELLWIERAGLHKKDFASATRFGH